MDVLVVVLEDEDEDVEAWASRLRRELAEFDGIDNVDTPQAGAGPLGTKGAGTAGGALLARVTGLDALRGLVAVVREWVARTGRSVEIRIDGNVLKLNKVSREQQDRLIEAWIARHITAP